MPVNSSFSFSRRRALASSALFAAAIIAAPSFALAPGFAAYSKSAFDTALKGAKPVLVHVHAEWCPVCKKQEVVFNELSKTPDFGKLTAFTVDFDKETDFKKAHNVANQSVILIFKGGKEIARSGGETNKDKIAALLADAAK